MPAHALIEQQPLRSQPVTNNHSETVSEITQRRKISLRRKMFTQAKLKRACYSYCVYGSGPPSLHCRHKASASASALISRTPPSKPPQPLRKTADRIFQASSLFIKRHVSITFSTFLIKTVLSLDPRWWTTHLQAVLSCYLIKKNQHLELDCGGLNSETNLNLKFNLSNSTLSLTKQKTF